MKNKYLIIIVLGLILAAGAIASLVLFKSPTTPNNSDTDNNPLSNPSSKIKTYPVTIENFAFSPSSLTIKKGEKVIWTNQDSAAHTVTSDSGNELGSKLLAKGESYSHIFNTVGTFNYHCTPHPYMKGIIIVE